MIARGRRARLRRLHRDRLAARRTCRRRRRAPGSTSPRGSGSPTAAACSSCRRRTRSAPLRARSRGALPPVVHVHFHDYELLDAEAARRAARVTLRAARAPPHAGRARRARRPTARSTGPTYAPADRRSRRSPPLLAGCGSATADARRVSIAGRPEPVPHHDPPRRQAGGRARTQDARLRYQLASSGDQHTLTKVISSTRRTSTRSRPTSRAARRRSRSSRRRERRSDRGAPASGDGRAGRSTTPSRHGPDEHFLGGGEQRRLGRPARPDRPDQGRRRVLVRAGPVLRELGRLGPAARRPATSPRSRSRARRAATRLPSSASEPRVRVPARSPTGPRSASRARGSTRSSTSGRSRRRSPTTRPTTGRPRGAAAVGARADQVARRRSAGPAEVLEDVDAPPGGRDPARLGAARQPVGDLHRHAHLRPRRASPTRPA